MIYRHCFQHLYGVERRRIAPTPSDDLRLHRLERPDPWDEELLREMWNVMPVNVANFYPDYAAFHRKLADFVGVAPDYIVMGQGIEEHIRSLAFLCCDPGDGMAFTWPTCAMFDIYATIVGARPVHLVTDPDRPMTVPEMIERIDPGVRLVILPNPGQPLETNYSHETIAAIAKHCRSIGAVLAIDEAYMGFGARSALPLVADFYNLLILRTFSKALGGAGLRIGYAIGQHLAIKPLDAARASGEIAGPSMHAAWAMMDNWETHIRPGIEAIVDGRNWLRDQLNAAGFAARGQWANHVLIDMRRDDIAARVYADLTKLGVHVRRNSAPLSRHLMVTCGKRATMERFFEAFKRVAG